MTDIPHIPALDLRPLLVKDFSCKASNQNESPWARMNLLRRQAGEIYARSLRLLHRALALTHRPHNGAMENGKRHARCAKISSGQS